MKLFILVMICTSSCFCGENDTFERLSEIIEISIRTHSCGLPLRPNFVFDSRLTTLQNIFNILSILGDIRYFQSYDMTVIKIIKESLFASKTNDEIIEKIFNNYPDHSFKVRCWSPGLPRPIYEPGYEVIGKLLILLIIITGLTENKPLEQIINDIYTKLKPLTQIINDINAKLNLDDEAMRALIESLRPFILLQKTLTKDEDKTKNTINIAYCIMTYNDIMSFSLDRSYKYLYPDLYQALATIATKDIENISPRNPFKALCCVLCVDRCVDLTAQPLVLSADLMIGSLLTIEDPIVSRLTIEMIKKVQVFSMLMQDGARDKIILLQPYFFYVENLLFQMITSEVFQTDPTYYTKIILETIDTYLLLSSDFKKVPTVRKILLELNSYLKTSCAKFDIEIDFKSVMTMYTLAADDSSGDFDLIKQVLIESTKKAVMRYIMGSTILLVDCIDISDCADIGDIYRNYLEQKVVPMNIILRNLSREQLENLIANRHFYQTYWSNFFQCFRRAQSLYVSLFIFTIKNIKDDSPAQSRGKYMENIINLIPDSALQIITIEKFSQNPEYYTRFLLETAFLCLNFPNFSTEKVTTLLLKLNNYLTKIPTKVLSDLKLDDPWKLLSALDCNQSCDLIIEILYRQCAMQNIKSINLDLNVYVFIHTLSQKALMDFARIDEEISSKLKSVDEPFSKLILLSIIQDCELTDLHITKLKDDLPSMLEYLKELKEYCGAWGCCITNPIGVLESIYIQCLRDEPCLFKMLKEFRYMYEFYKTTDQDKEFAMYACAQYLKHNTPLDKISKLAYYLNRIAIHHFGKIVIVMIVICLIALYIKILYGCLLILLSLFIAYVISRYK